MTRSRLGLLHELAQPGDPILFIVLDGIGDLPIAGKTALSRAKTPNLDKLARHANLGLLDPVNRGITPGSGVGHLSLFGYDVYEHGAERGVLEALGVGLDLSDGSVAIRANFVTLDGKGNIIDRRAGRIPSDEAERIVKKLAKGIKEIDGVKVDIRHIKEYRFAVVLRDKKLGGNVDDTDPQKNGVPPLKAKARDKQSQRTAKLLDLFAAKAAKVLKDEPKANGVTLRGIGKQPAIPTFQELYGMRGAVVAHYPMYRGVARLIGMDIVDVQGEGEAMPEKIAKVQEIWGKYDFVFLHVKKTDSSGEDGKQDQKAKIIELFDAALPKLLALKPAVVSITGDHSTPATMKAHSWHPVPVLVKGPHMRTCPATRYTEDECLKGALGRFRGMDLMAELLAQAGRLKKFGA